jgi:hypothetical protein
MSATAAMALPSSRVVLTWWRELAGLSPRRLWFAHLILHLIEVLVEAETPRPLEPITSAVWSRLASSDTPLSIEDISDRLSLESHLLWMALNDLAGRKLASLESGGWRATGTGPSPADIVTRPERRTFTFADGRPPTFLPLTAPTPPLPPTPGWRFDLSALQTCIEQPREWKVRHGFPLDVVRLISSEDWHAVAVDQPAQAVLLFVETRAGELLGHSVRGDSWSLSAEPVLRGSPEILTSLGADPGADGWRQAWQSWSQQRSLPGGEVEMCKLAPIDHRLVVSAPAKLLDRLRAARSDALKGESWILAGSGRVRSAAMLDLVEG